MMQPAWHSQTNYKVSYFMWKQLVNRIALMVFLQSAKAVALANESLLLAEPSSQGTYISIVQVQKNYVAEVNEAIEADEGLAVWDAVMDPFFRVPFCGDLWSINALHVQHGVGRAKVKGAQFKDFAEVWDWLLGAGTRKWEIRPLYQYRAGKFQINGKVSLLTEPYAISVRRKVESTSLTAAGWAQLTRTMYLYSQNSGEHGDSKKRRARVEQSVDSSPSIAEYFVEALKSRGVKCQAKFVKSVNALWINADDADIEKIEQLINDLIRDNSPL
jgi:hypothetical protein